MPPAMKRLLANLQLPANRFDRRALVEVHLRLAQSRNDPLRRVSVPFHRVLPPSRAVRLSYQLVHLEGVRSLAPELMSRMSGYPTFEAHSSYISACSRRQSRTSPIWGESRATRSATCKAAEDDCLERRNSIRPCVPSHVAYKAERRGNELFWSPWKMYPRSQERHRNREATVYLPA